MNKLHLSFIIAFLSINFSIKAQDTKLTAYKVAINKSLYTWTKSFKHFSIDSFTQVDSLGFENINYDDFKTDAAFNARLKSFLAIYKPIITYSPNNNSFIDIYSYQLHLTKKGNNYEANTEVDGAVYLCKQKEKNWKRIFFNGTSKWIDDVIWVNNSEFILVGIEKSIDEKKSLPIICICNSDNSTAIVFSNRSGNCYQNKNGYSSSKLKKIKIVYK